MKLWFIGMLICSSALAAEVATLELSKSSNEIVLIMTDDTMNPSMEKHFMTKTCRARSYMNTQASSVREHAFPKVCRAEIIQFLLNNGYKPDQQYATFSKQISQLRASQFSAFYVDKCS
jgi:hypothetical protein